MKLDLKNILQNDHDSFDLIQNIGKIADDMDIQAYLVGGFVRDLILQRKNKDIDIVVVGDGLAFADKVSDTLGLYPVVKYKEFATAMIPLKSVEIEIVSARKEVYQQHSRNPKVEFTNLDEDLRRRDFTINTMALSINANSFGKFIDPFTGVKDLNSKMIITPLDPKETFFEDPLRMLRAIRFASQLHFDIEESTFQAIREYASRISIISKERIRDEFIKILMSDKPSFGIDLLSSSGLMHEVFPQLEKLKGVDSHDGFKHKDVYLHTLTVLDNVAAVSDDINLRFAALFHDIAKPQCKRFVKGSGWTFHGHEELGARMFDKIARDLRLSQKDIKIISKLIRLHLRPIVIAKDDVTDSAVRRLIVDAGEEIDKLMILCRADITSKNKLRVKKYMQNFELVEQKIIEVEQKDALRTFQSPFDGKEIMTMFDLKPGPEIGKIKHFIEEAILEGIIANDHDEAKDYIIKNKQKLIDLFLSKP
ncbi:MAG: CCA tRNA nucleotidyltransferase [Candidatus Neomarinimicrobiota bacterium]